MSIWLIRPCHTRTDNLADLNLRGRRWDRWAPRRPCCPPGRCWSCGTCRGRGPSWAATPPRGWARPSPCSWWWRWRSGPPGWRAVARSQWWASLSGKNKRCSMAPFVGCSLVKLLARLDVVRKVPGSNIGRNLKTELRRAKAMRRNGKVLCLIIRSQIRVKWI